MRTPNAYERAALREIAAFRAEVFPPTRAGERDEGAEADPSPHPQGGGASTAARGAAGRSVVAGQPGIVGRLRSRLLAALAAPLQQAVDEACALAKPGQVLAAFHEAGYAGVKTTRDIQHLSLHEVDRVSGGMRRRHTIAAALLGMTGGVLGGLGALLEAPAIATVALRAIVDCARHHGFDVADEKERAFVLDVLAVATAPTPLARQSALEHATKLIWPPVTAAVPPSSGVVAARVLGRRVLQAALFHLAKRHIGRATPLVTAALGGVLNARYVYRVATVASLLYRERFLIRRCGPAMVALCEAGVEMAPGTTFGHHPLMPHGNTPMALS